jgi:CTP:molybdopterin cytidylyltransferase MocA
MAAIAASSRRLATCSATYRNPTKAPPSSSIKTATRFSHQNRRGLSVVSGDMPASAISAFYPARPVLVADNQRPILHFSPASFLAEVSYD